MNLRLSPIVVAIALTLPLLAEAKVYTDDVVVSDTVVTETQYALAGANVSFTAENISGKGFIASNHVNHSTLTDQSHMTIGNSQTKRVEINNHADGFVSGISAYGRGNAVGVAGSTVTVNTKDLILDLYSENDYVYGIYAMNASTDRRDENGVPVEGKPETAKIVINAKNTIINATTGVKVDPNDKDNRAIAMAVWSEGELEINGNLEVNAATVLAVRGKSLTNINAENDASKVIKLNGDINFNYNKETSGTPVNAVVNINLANEQSFLNGNIVINGVNIPNGYDEVNAMNLGLSNGGTWIVPKNTMDYPGADAAINLTMDGGVISVEDYQHVVPVRVFKGTGGTLNLAASVESGSLKTAQIAIKDIAQTRARAAGPSFEVMYTGVNADTVTEEMVKAADAPITYAGNSSAVLPGATVNQIVTEGDIRGALTVATTYDANGDVADVSTSQTQNSKLDAFGSVNALSAMTWRHEMNSLSKRMGELRDAPAGVGTWARYYGSEMEYGDQNLTSKNNTIQMGSDYTIGDWKVGVAANYTDGESSYNNGSADSKNYGLAVYGTWFVPCGAYVDLIAKYSRLDNDFALNGMDGSYENNAFSVSAETGYRFEFLDGGLFVEPQMGVSYGRIMGDDFTAKNGVRIEQDDYDSLIGRVGVRTGFKFPKDKGLIYARVSGVYDFQGEMDAVASKDGLKQNITEDLGGAWLEFGVGANFNWTNNTYSYIDVERTNGGDVKENYRFNVGIRHTF